MVVDVQEGEGLAAEGEEHRIDELEVLRYGDGTVE